MLLNVNQCTCRTHAMHQVQAIDIRMYVYHRNYAYAFDMAMYTCGLRMHNILLSIKFLSITECKHKVVAWL